MSFWAGKGIRRIDGGALGEGEAGLLLPAGADGPAFLVTHNFDAIYSYNPSDSYALAVAILAQRLAGGPDIETPWPTDDPGLSRKGAARAAGAADQGRLRRRRARRRDRRQDQVRDRRLQGKHGMTVGRPRVEEGAGGASALRPRRHAMEAATPSRTAMGTALMRALHTRADPLPLIDDPWGERLLEPARAVFEARMRELHPGDDADAQMRAGAAYPNVIVRARFCEDALRSGGRARRQTICDRRRRLRLLRAAPPRLGGDARDHRSRSSRDADLQARTPRRRAASLATGRELMSPPISARSAGRTR